MAADAGLLGFATTLLDGVRATVFLRPRRTPVGASAGVFIGLVGLYLVVEAVAGWFETEPPRAFTGFGVLTVLADSLLTFVAAWIVSRFAARPATLWSVASVMLAATIVIARLVNALLGVAAFELDSRGHFLVASVIEWLSIAWWLFVLIGIARWVMPRMMSKALVSAVLAFGVSAVAWQFLPGAPVIAQDAHALMQQQLADGEAGDATPSNDDDAEPTIAFDAEAVLYEQPRLLDAAFAALAPRTPGRPNLWVIAFAGDGAENVFRNEAEYVERLFSTRFGAAGHVVVLENHPATVEQRPLATLTNLRRTLAAIARRMDPAEDILLVYLTSHGSAQHELAVSLDPLPLNAITPDDLAEAMRADPAPRWKVAIVNACYSGGFVEALHDDSTLVITAARRDRTSFGCGADSDITYFGEAFLAEALNRTTSFTEAFEMARERVSEWEKEDGLEPPSEPQIAGSRRIDAKLDAWRSTLAPSAAVPFEPAVAGDGEQKERTP